MCQCLFKTFKSTKLNDNETSGSNLVFVYYSKFDWNWLSGSGHVGS